MYEQFMSSETILTELLSGARAFCEFEAVLKIFRESFVFIRGLWKAAYVLFQARNQNFSLVTESRA